MMMHRLGSLYPFIFCLLVILCSSKCVTGQSVNENRLPNIVLILADDLGYGDLSCYNPESKVPTPNIDRLAKEGIRFTDMHSPATVCTPTRYSLLTGQMAFRVANGGKVFTGAGGPCLIDLGRWTIPSMLKRHQYETALFGKWHVGLTFRDHQGVPIHAGDLESVRRIDFSRRIDGGPLDHGFDRFFGTACCPTTDWLYAFIDGDRIPIPPNRVIDKTALPKHPYANDCREGLIASDFEMEEVDRVFLSRSRAFIEQHQKVHSDRPFFLMLATQAVHLPSFAAPSFVGKSKAGPHGDFLLQLDYEVGELMGYLEELGAADNTLVIFTSDNGPETTSILHMRDDYQHDGARPWRGMKRDAWEGGHRIPFIAKWKNRIASNTVSDQIASLTDVFSTIAEITNTEMPVNCAEDSFSLLPILKGKQPNNDRPYLLTQAFGGAKTLSIRQGNWKYIDHAGSGGNRYTKDTPLARFALSESASDANSQLYNLNVDPGEKNNLVREFPDQAAALKKLLEESVRLGRSR